MECKIYLKQYKRIYHVKKKSWYLPAIAEWVKNGSGNWFLQQIIRVILY